MLDTIRDIIREASIRGARMHANDGNLSLVNWMDGRLSALALLWPDSIEIQASRNEARFLCSYTRRHFKG